MIIIFRFLLLWKNRWSYCIERGLRDEKKWPRSLLCSLDSFFFCYFLRPAPRFFAVRASKDFIHHRRRKRLKSYHERQEAARDSGKMAPRVRRSYREGWKDEAFHSQLLPHPWETSQWTTRYKVVLYLFSPSVALRCPPPLGPMFTLWRDTPSGQVEIFFLT